VTVRQKARGKGNPWWVFTSHNGKRKSLRVGDKDAANEVASKIQAKLQQPGDLSFERPQRIPTAQGVCGDFHGRILEAQTQAYDNSHSGLIS
jgi:hypothetical protein